MADLSGYHLRVICEADGARRARHNKRLDPESRRQAIGCDDLVDPTGCELAEIPSDRRFKPFEMPPAPADDGESLG